MITLNQEVILSISWII